MQISWGLKIALLYSGFAVGIVFLVVASSRQKIDLVSADYYKQEIGYQKVIDASRNHAALTAPVNIHANSDAVIFEFPSELNDKVVTADIDFYSPINKEWDRNFNVTTSNNRVVINRDKLEHKNYVIKLGFSAEGKSYYQESEIQLSKQ
ncbi:MAG: hypothetical protein K0Q79_1693 [Flavipsychrobacter sp.]|jgi:hypothetical protein|nr:hypothetical protein [Flavipsychrobacter sp.]